MKKAVVLLSGGQDSTTCLYWTKQNFETVVAIGFDYGQSHKIELERAKKIAADAGVEYKIFNVEGLLSASSLIDHSDHNLPSRINPDLPDSFTAGRNLLFLTIAASFSAAREIKNLVTGVCQTDYSGYPDCRRTTIDAMQLALSLGCGVGDFEIHTPLMYINKAQTWQLAKELGCLDVIINDTITDYSGDLTMNEWGAGTIGNPASKLRAQGYEEAKQNGWI
ncbi:MAG: 7-cyano-7-deazaguanine synthase QueC [Methylovulum sp.]